jgi:hypothetical protein
VRSGDAAQASVDFTNNGFHAGAWTSRPLAVGGSGETDLEAGYAFKITEQFTLEPTVTQYTYANATPDATRQSTEAGLQAVWEAGGGWTASVACYHDFRLQADTAQAEAGYSLALKNLGAFLEFNSFAGWANGANLRPGAAGPRVHDGYAYCGAEVRLPYRVGAHTTVVAGLHFSDAVGQSRSWSPTGAGSTARGWFSFAVNFDF